LPSKVLAESGLLAFERSGERFQRAIVDAAQHTTTTPVVEEGVNGFLEHALFVAHDDFRRAQFHQLLETVVAIDHATIEIVEIGSREATTIERHQRRSSGGIHRNHIEDHPLRVVARLEKRGHHLQALGEFQFLLLRSFFAHATT
jgi:hypothetical protein